MTKISAAQVKALRDRTAGGLLECKKALETTGGDIEAAVDFLRKAGQAKADKKSGRVAGDGRIGISIDEIGQQAALVEVNCETDFVAKNADFVAFIDALAEHIAATQPASLEELMASSLSEGNTVEQARHALVTKLGENIQVRRFDSMQVTEGVIGSYNHNNRIGVLVHLVSGELALAKDIAMHVAASQPQAVSQADLPEALVAREKDIYRARAESSGKPAEIIEKMLVGQLKKFIDSVTLIAQPFIKDPEIKVSDLLKKSNAEVKRFTRFGLGEGVAAE